MISGPFTIRVYALLKHWDKVLLVHERIGDFSFTKFPGGGMQYGEGTIDCLKREMMEETGLIITEATHYYTTDFFQPSAFHTEQQIVSVYYLVQAEFADKLREDEHVLKTGDRDEILRFEWVMLTDLNPDMLTFPIDKHVCRLLISETD
ncbi:MAG: NUDIX domain-containing protein [Bacteroidota bacterium]|jgi:8-oxo-dGTP diphosphatase